MERYIHETYTHNHDSPAEIVPVLMKILQPASVVDIGCGTGTFLNEFKKAGVGKVLGIDGPWANKQLLYTNLGKMEFREMDLEKPIVIGQRFDLAICLEVGEHLGAGYADQLAESIAALSDRIVFSGAIPHQGGQNHLNEQWPDYWAEKFIARGYLVLDVLRPIFWENGKIQWWYKQNMFLACKKDNLPDPGMFRPKGTHEAASYIHPDLYIERSKKLEGVLSGSEPFLFYLKLLAKKIIRRK